MQSVLERMEQDGTKEKIADFMEKQKYPYDIKVQYAERKAREFVRECGKRGLNTHISVGGLDSITLLVFLRKLGIDCPAVSCSLLEDKSIQQVHKELGVIGLYPAVREITGGVQKGGQNQVFYKSLVFRSCQKKLPQK